MTTSCGTFLSWGAFSSTPWAFAFTWAGVSKKMPIAWQVIAVERSVAGQHGSACHHWNGPYVVVRLDQVFSDVEGDVALGVEPSVARVLVDRPQDIVLR